MGVFYVHYVCVYKKKQICISINCVVSILQALFSLGLDDVVCKKEDQNIFFF